jgi:hypothetical protein
VAIFPLEGFTDTLHCNKILELSNFYRLLKEQFKIAKIILAACIFNGTAIYKNLIKLVGHPKGA